LAALIGPIPPFGRSHCLLLEPELVDAVEPPANAFRSIAKASLSQHDQPFSV
jgi:hypothetical protein